jgi:hypothetical protein
MRFFGDWRLDEPERCERPVGKACLYCGEPIGADDDGVVMPHFAEVATEEPWHRECFVRSFSGSVAHQSRHGVGPCDGACRDDPALTLRQAALAACAMFDARIKAG